jgi:Xaa-Pro aminopeptidase
MISPGGAMFAPATYLDRRSTLRGTLAGLGERGLLLFLGNDESPCNYADNTYPYRQDSTFLYYFGIDRPGFAAVIDLDEGSTTVFADDPGIDAIVWAGPQASVVELAARGGVDDVAPAAALGDRVRRATGAGQSVHVLPPYRAENTLRLMDLLDRRRAPEASVPFIRAVAEQRAVKSAEEIAEIERGVDLSIDMHLAAMRMARPGMREADIAARVTEIALAGGPGLSFPVIATVHGETLHNHYHGNTLEPGDVFLLDCGAESPEHYAGDVSSTFPVDRTFTGRQKDVYRVVLDAHLAAVAAAAPLVPMREVHRVACRRLAEGMKELGLMHGDMDDAVQAGAHALFFPCGTGHMLGLDVHDMENLGEVWVGYEGQPKSTQFGLKSLRLARPLKPGFVFTVEPGVYFIPALVRQWQAEARLRDFLDYAAIERWLGTGGMRIEEDLAVTAEGCRILGKPRPRTVEEVEALRG